MALFFVADDEGGDNYDLFVRAASASDALIIWRDYYDLPGFPKCIYRVPPYPYGDEINNPAPLAWGRDIQEVPKEDWRQ